MSNYQGLNILLSRTPLEVPFEDFLEEVKKTYDFREIYWYTPILEGYENANIKIDTDKGTFVIKIFAKEISDFQAESYITVTEEALKVGVPLTRLLEGNGGFLQKFSQIDNKAKYLLMYFFDAPNFEQQRVHMEDITKVTEYLAKFNSIDFPVGEVYDSWGNKNFVKEYEKFKEKVSQEVYEAIAPVMEDFSKIDFTDFSRSIIHADLQRKHIMKNKDGKYCILDLGCMRNDARVYEVSIHLAWFCLSQDNWDQREEIASAVLAEYTKIHPLSLNELHALPILLQAAYAAYLLKTSLLIQSGDTSQETKEWHNVAKEMLSRCKEWKWQL